MKKIIIGHAVCDENGKASGGKAGDQTGREVRFQDYYSGWEYVFRANDAETGRNIASTMCDAVNNDNIGYNQKSRGTLYKKAVAKDFKLSDIKQKCSCDCSSLAAVCINAAGIKIDPDMYTGNEKQLIEATGCFKTISGPIDENKLKVGDILLKPGHTAVVVKVEDVEKKTWFRVQTCACNNLTTANYFVKILTDTGLQGTIAKGTKTAYIVYAGDYATKAEADAVAHICHYASIPTYIYNVTY